LLRCLSTHSGSSATTHTHTHTHSRAHSNVMQARTIMQAQHTALRVQHMRAAKGLATQPSHGRGGVVAESDGGEAEAEAASPASSSSPSSPSSPAASAPFPPWYRSILTEIYLCHACSDHAILRMKAARQAARDFLHRANALLRSSPRDGPDNLGAGAGAALAPPPPPPPEGGGEHDAEISSGAFLCHPWSGHVCAVCPDHDDPSIGGHPMQQGWWGPSERLWYHLHVISIQTEILTWLIFPYVFECWET
jgi:hypothetical protein